ncbi:hypothetical protein F5Y08DRAFT_343966 [Xylaria arbuscula]|nr:hypothetical protein F5Y08DRAFT_343966 [Xylaria arbuscula]
MQKYIPLASLLLAGLSSSSPTAVINSRTTFNNTCNLHVIELYKTAYPSSMFTFDLFTTYVNGSNVNSTHIAIEDYNAHETHVEIGLPYTLVIIPGFASSDPVYFKYAGYGFSSSRGCTINATGGYFQIMDCRFAC